MSVYVDDLMNFGNGTGFWKGRKSCHLIADSIPELIEFAVSIGLRKEWFQSKSTPHFDLTVRKREQAVKAGAIELDRNKFVAKMRELRGDKWLAK